MELAHKKQGPTMQDCSAYCEPQKEEENVYEHIQKSDSYKAKAWQLRFLQSHKLLIAIVLFMLILILCNFAVTLTLYLKNKCIPAQTYPCSCKNMSTSDKLNNDTVKTDPEILTDNETCEELAGVVAALSHLKNNSISISSTANDILFLVKENLKLQNVTTAIPTSCQEVKEILPNSPSGYYHLQGRDVYCHIETLCGSKGPWTRVANLDMHDATENCPPGFRLYQSGTTRACGRQKSDTGSCQSVQYSTNGMNYSEVCGRVIGYQKGTTDAIEKYTNDPNHDNINSYYVDGVSITHGSSRHHIWTLMSGYKDGSSIPTANCPCSTGSMQSSNIQTFVGTNYFCESGSPGDPSNDIMYTGDPLWDRQGCGSDEPDCCKAEGLPWFHNVLKSATSDYVELRVCADQGTDDEDIPLGFYEIYLK